MRKIILLASLLLIVVAAINAPRALAFNPNAVVCSQNAQAQSTSFCATDPTGNGLVYGGQHSILSNIINIFSLVIGIIAIFMIIIAGFEYVTSGGDSGKINTAKDTILFAVVGIVVVAVAQIIVNLIMVRLLKIAV